MNIEKNLPVVMAWKRGFNLVRIEEIIPRYLTLELRGYPDGFHGRKWVVWCRRVVGELHFKGDFLWCLGLPARAETAARMIFAEIQAQLESKRMASESQPKPDELSALANSQLRLLAKQYPETVRCFRALSDSTALAEVTRWRQEMARVFVEETFANHGVLLDPVADEEQLLRMAALRARMKARERQPDPVEYELITGCHAKGYCRMKVADVCEAVGKAAGYKPTIDALRKKWKRLGLPSERKRGAPRVCADK